MNLASSLFCISFLLVMPTGQSQDLERFPRAIMVTGPGCLPCLRVKQENPQIVGDLPSFPVQSVAIGNLDTIGLDQKEVSQVPTFFILEAPGVFHEANPGTLCRHVGYKSPEALKSYLAHETHNVSLEPLEVYAQEGPDLAQDEPPVVQGKAKREARKWGSPFQPEASELEIKTSEILPAIAYHFAEAAGEELKVGGLFDIRLNVPDSIPEALSGFIANGSYEFGGVKASYPRSTNITTTRTAGGLVVSFSEPLRMDYSGRFVTVAAGLHSILVSPDGKTITLDLQRSPGSVVPIPNLTLHLE